MSSATRASFEAVQSASNAALTPSADEAREVLAAARLIESNGQLQTALTDSVASQDARAALAERIFGQLSSTARGVIASAARGRWSKPADIVDTLEAVGIQLMAKSADARVVGDELAQFAKTVSTAPELELALSDQRATGEAKASITDRLLSGKAKEQTVSIVNHLVRSPRGRRIRALLSIAQQQVAEATGESLATVTTAKALPADQVSRLTEGLQRKYGRQLRLAQVIDPTIIGGLRVTVGDDVIDGTIRSKYNDLRLKLG